MTTIKIILEKDMTMKIGEILCEAISEENPSTECKVVVDYANYHGIISLIIEDGADTNKTVNITTKDYSIIDNG